MSDGQPQPASQALEVASRLQRLYPELVPFLRYRSPFELLVGVVLSAQSTDAQVNRILGQLIDRWPHPCDWARLPLPDIEKAIYSTGYYRSKARNLHRTSQILCEQGGEVPLDMDELLRLPGVGRKSANVLRGALGGLPAIIVDTHFARVVRRLGLTKASHPERIEKELAGMIAPESSYGFSMRVNLHGRLICQARKPRCPDCELRHVCEYHLTQKNGA